MKQRSSQLYLHNSYLPPQTLNTVISPKSFQSEQLFDKLPRTLKFHLRFQKSKIRSNVQIDYRNLKSTITGAVCPICQTSLTEDGTSIADCGHKFCQQCLMTYIAHKICSMQEILCPQDGCNLKANPNCDIFQKMPEQYKKKYKRQQLFYQTNGNPNIKVCPNEKCQDGLLNFQLSKNQWVRCQKCQQKYCKQCLMPFHPDDQCEQSIIKNFKDFRQCPKCTIIIEKKSGCNHMTCRCKHQFCFVCLSDWNKLHYNCQSLNQNQVLIQRQNCKFPKIMAIFLVTLLIPLLLIIVALLILFTLLFILCGFIFGAVELCQQIKNRKEKIPLCCLIIICVPLVIIVYPVFVVVNIVKTVYQGTQWSFTRIQYFKQLYFRTIRRLWGQQTAQYSQFQSDL